MATKLQRATITPPRGFDPSKTAHVQAVLTKLAETQGGEDWEVEFFDPESGRLTAVRQAAITQMDAGASGAARMTLSLQKGTKPADGDKVAARFEDANPGYTLTGFDPYLGQATMTRLSAEEKRARDAVRVALGVKPWDVQVASRSDGGFSLGLPKSYVPSKHEDKLTEVAEEVVGQVGWYVQVDAEALTAQIIPGTRPTFDPAYIFPVNARFDPLSLPIGVTLPAPGQQHGRLEVDLEDKIGLLMQGLAGSGKTQAIGGFIYAALASGHQVAVVDVPHKKADFEWMKPFVRENGWGCDSLEQSLAVVNMVYEEGQARGRLFDEYGVKKWQDLPAGARREHPILTLVVDELSGLLTKPPIPKSLPKDDPMRLEAEETAAACDKLSILLTKLPAEMRAAGIRVLYASQQAQSNMSIPPSIKINIPNRMLLGGNQSKQQRGHAFAVPEKAPWVPDYLAADAKASRGVGVAEFEGTPPVVFKGFYASDEDFTAALDKGGVARADNPNPTPAQIEAVMPRLRDDDEGRPGSRLDTGGWGEQDGRDAPEPELKGAAAASQALRQSIDEST